MKARIAYHCKPPWYMGHAYDSVASHYSVYYIIPLHIIANWLWHLNYLWNRRRSKESWIDKKVKESMGHNYKRLQELERRKNYEGKSN